MNAIATLTSKGQVTIPQAIREALGLDTGSRLCFELENGELKIHSLGGKTWTDVWKTTKGNPKPDEVVDVKAAVQSAVRARSVR